MKNYLKKINIITKLKTINEKLKQHNMLDLPPVTFINPYQMFLDWLLETLQYGLAILVVYFVFITKFKPLYILGFGVMRWLYLDIVRETKNAIKN